MEVKSLKQQAQEELTRLARVEWRIGKIAQEGFEPKHEIVLKQVQPQTVATVRDVVSRRGDTRQLLEEVMVHIEQYRAKPVGFPLIVW